MSPRIRVASLALLIAAAACAERSPGPTGEDAAGLPDGRKTSILASDERGRLEALTRTVALALRNPAVRGQLKADLDRSPIREHKLHFQRYLLDGTRPLAREMARASGVSEAALRADAQSALGLELYLPVPEHRATWSGDAEILVATALGDHDEPVAFDLQGRRQVLSPDRPPVTPVLALVPVETDFDAVGPMGTITVCPQGVSANCSGTAGGEPPSGAGLWMTSAAFSQTFEGWLKGSPEFETHILGQAGTSDSLTDYQCAGEKQLGAYYYDQNSTTWSGNVMLFSQAQIDGYKAAHPNNSMRVVVVEDDDTACQLKLDAGRFRAALNLVDSTYREFTAGRDSTLGLTRIWNKAKAFQKMLQAVWSFITTQDDYVGTAIQDTVAGEYRAGANWIVKGEKNLTTGALKLEMR